MGLLRWRTDAVSPYRCWARLLALVLAPLLAVLLAACGGGGSDTPQPTVMAPLLQSVAPAASAAADSGYEDSPAHSLAAPGNGPVYSIVNLGSDAGLGVALNTRGQALFSNFGNAGLYNGFFDGERIHDIASLGGGYTVTWGLNDHGVVVGESEDDGQPYSHIRAMTWSVADGMRALEGDYLAQGRAINNRRQVAGYAQADGLSAQAARWNADGLLRRLGPRPYSLSQAYAINQDGLSAGFADLASGAIHAVRWHADGSQIDLGTLGGDSAFAEHINGRGHVAGVSASADGRLLAFFWSPRGGMQSLGAEGGGARLVAALNDRSEVAGNAQDGELSKPYLWTRRYGLAPLPLGGAAQGDVFALNSQGQMAGAVQDGPDWRTRRAVRWPGVATPIDLNTRLHRPPSGLHLYAGAAINGDGFILAHSNAGLVLLRPGKRGSSAPVVGPLQGLPDTVTLGDSLPLKISFTDNGMHDTHRATVRWSDGCASTAPVVREARGTGEATMRHTFCAAGMHAVTVRVIDSGGRETVVRRDVLVADPAHAVVAGRGTLAATAGEARTLQFALWAPLTPATPGTVGRASGRPYVELAGPFRFRSSSVQRVERKGSVVRIEADGARNGREGYRIVIDAVDGGEADRMRVRLSHRDHASGAEVLDYDSAAAAPTSLQRASASEAMPSADAPVQWGGIELPE